MVIDARHRLATVKQLPYDAEIEYLEGGNVNNGIAFVDTGYSPNSQTILRAKSAILTASGYSGRFGNRARFTFGLANNDIYLGQGNHYYLGSATLGVFYTFENDISNRIVKTEDTSTTTLTVDDWFTQLYPIYLFASNLQPLTNGTEVNGYMLDSASIGRIRLASCSIIEGNTLVRDFIPVRFTNELGQSEGAMYDKVSGQLFRNEGSGEFVMGPDVAPAPYVVTYRKPFVSFTHPPSARNYISDGLIAMWDGIENVGWGTHDATATVWKDLAGSVGDAVFNRTGATFGDVAVNFNNTASRLQTPIYSVSNVVLTMELVARRTGGYSNGEIGALWENPWFGINLRSGNVRFTFGTDIDYYRNVSDAQTYTLIRYSGDNRFYAGASLLGTSNRGITSMNTGRLGIGSWQTNALIVSGDIYCVRLYLRALTAEEIAHNYKIDKIRFNLP